VKDQTGDDRVEARGIQDAVETRAKGFRRHGSILETEGSALSKTEE
jgi:hypothetical protein